MNISHPVRLMGVALGVGISILGVNSKAIQAQNYPYCFMINQQGQLIDLSSICGKSSPETVKESKQNSQQNDQSEKKTSPQEDYKKLMNLYGSESEDPDQGLKVPPFLEKTITQDKYDNRLRCQLIVERVNQDPSLLQPKTITRPVLIPIGGEGYSTESITDKDPLGSLGGASVGIINRCRYGGGL